MIEQLSNLGLAVIMSSHYPDNAFLAASKVAIMKDKSFIDFGSPEEVLTEENLKKAYGIDVKLIELDSDRKICVCSTPALHTWHRCVRKLLDAIITREWSSV